MKKVIFALSMLCLVACGPSAEEKAAMDRKDLETGKTVIGSNGATYNIVIIDGCEYVQGWKGNSYGGPIMTHKGNCKNPFHKQ